MSETRPGRGDDRGDDRATRTARGDDLTRATRTVLGDRAGAPRSGRGDQRARRSDAHPPGARLLGGAARLVLLRYRERGPEIVATARAGATDRGAAFAEAASLLALALRPARTRSVWLHGALIAAALVLLARLTPLALVVPFVLLALGVFDARLAAGATLFWLFRLLTADLAEGHLARWLLMLAGLALAAHVTRLSLRRAAAL
jgi:hypothetical protein